MKHTPRSIRRRPQGRHLSNLAMTLWSLPLIAMVMSGCTRSNPANGPGDGDFEPDLAAPFIEGELLARFPVGMTREEVQARVEPWGGQVLDGLTSEDLEVMSESTMVHLGGTWRIGLPSGVTVEEGIELLGAEDDLVLAEPNHIVEAVKTPNDPDYNQLYGMEKISAPLAWDVTTGSRDVVVAVIDTGVDYNHPDLADNIWTNPGEIPDNGVDDDGNGYVDDYYGYDFCNNDADPFDDHYHGTHCAGTVAATGDNSRGVPGVAWRASIMSIKFLCGNGSGSSWAAARAIRYAVDNGAVISSNSWGGTGRSSSISSAIDYARERGQLFIAAAGNSNKNMDHTNFYPAGYDHDNIISVAASDSSDRRASFSNYSSSRVDLAAPGVRIRSTIPNNRYGSLSGTSMAAPHVSGAAVLLKARDPEMSYAAVKNHLLESVDPLDNWNGVVATGGRMNVAAALGRVAPKPEAPTGVVASVLDGSRAEVKWQPSPDEGVTTYYVHLYDADGMPMPPLVAIEGRDNTQAVLGPLDAGDYLVAVSALNSVGESAQSQQARFSLVDADPPAQVPDLRVTPLEGDLVAVEGAEADSDFGPDWTVSHLVDDDASTAWAAEPSAAQQPATVVFDLGQVKDVGQVKLRPAAGFPELFPRAFEVAASVDGEQWTTVIREIPEGPNDGGVMGRDPLVEWHPWIIDPVPARMLRLTVTERAEHEGGLFYAVVGDVAFHEQALDSSALLASWTAPGDDGGAGRAASFDLRAAPGLTADGFDAAPKFPTPEPGMAGTRHFATLSGLPGETEIGVAIAARDESGNRGPLSNIAVARTLGVAPGGIDDLEVTADGEAVVLSWTAPADDGRDPASGPVASVRIQVSNSPLDSAHWADSEPLQVSVQPVAPGTRQVVRVENPLEALPQGPRWFFRVRAVDEAALLGPWSNEGALNAPPRFDQSPPGTISFLNGHYVAALSQPVLMAVDGDADRLALLDRDPRTGWMVEADADAGVTLSFGQVEGEAFPLTRVRLLPHMLYPGDVPGEIQIIAPSPQGGGEMVLTRRVIPQEEIVPGQPIDLDFAPVMTREFKVQLLAPRERFGLTAVALAEVSAYEALPGGGAARLTWVAPGDDGFEGLAEEYDLRRSDAPIEGGAFDQAEPVGPIAAPQLAGALEVTDVGGLPEGRDSWFALRTRDDAGNWSGVSETVRVSVPAIPPGGIVDLQVVETGKDSAILSWTAPGDDGDVGTVTDYDLRFAESPITVESFPDAMRVEAPEPSLAGTLERVQVSGLPSGRTLYFAVMARDEVGASSGLSNIAEGTTRESTPPSPVADLTAGAGPETGSILVAFTASGDDASQGTAAAYDLRYVIGQEMSPEGFEQAIPIPLNTRPQQAGARELLTLAGLPAETDIALALVVIDDAGNRSGMSNVAPVRVPGAAPSQVNDLAIAQAGANDMVVQFTAVGDDGLEGTAARYDLRVSASPISNDGDFDQARSVPVGAAKPAGERMTVSVPGLDDATLYHFAVVAFDDAGNRSPLSNLASGYTADATAPEAIGDLRAQAQPSGTSALEASIAGDTDAYGEATGPELLLDGSSQSAWITPVRDAASEESVVIAVRGADGGLAEVAGIRLRAAADYPDLFPSTFTIEAHDGTGADPLSADVPEEGWQVVVRSEGASASAAEALERRFAPQQARWLRLRAETEIDEAGRHLLAVGDFEALAADNGSASVQLTWTVPSDKGPTGRPARYEVRYAAFPLTAENFEQGTEAGAGAPSQPGGPEALVVSGLNPETRYHFAVVSIDDAGNRSALSNSAEAETPGVAPGTVLDLRGTELEQDRLVLTWTAPGADGDAGGSADRYDIRMSAAPITVDNFEQAAIVEGAGGPAVPGEVERLPVAGLEPGTDYYFALRAYDGDEASALSNVAQVRTLEPPEQVPPATVQDLAATTDERVAGAVAVTWTAPGDDGNLGQATRYDLRWSASPINDGNFASATSVQGLDAPQAAGAQESTIVTGLPGESAVWFALVTYDDVGNMSGLSNIAEAATRAEPPAQIVDLAAEVRGAEGVLTWTAPGADGEEGRAAAYQLYIETAQFDSVEGLTPVADAPAPAEAGSAEQYVAALSNDTTYYAAIRAIDPQGNPGQLSPVVGFQTDDGVAPGRPVQLVARTGDAAGTLSVSFGAPGDDGYDGTPAQYEVRWSTSAFDAAGFEQANLYVGDLAVGVGGSEHTLTLSGLPGEQRIYVALRATDDAGLVGDISDVASAETPDVAPSQIADLTAESVGDGGIALRWTAPGDDGAEGTAVAYEGRMGTEPVTEDNFDQMQPIPNLGAPAQGGAAESLAVEGLAGNTTYHFALRAIDERGNRGALSASASASTPDQAGPAPVADLQAQTGNNAGEVILTWTAAGDDGMEGTASSVEIRYAGDAWPGFEQAAVAQAAVTPVAGGERHEVTVTGLPSESDLTFALVTVDEGGNRAAPSNVAAAQTLGVAPGAPSDLIVAAEGAAALRLQFTAPADDGDDAESGAVAALEIAYSTEPFDGADFDQQQRVAGPAPEAPGATQSAVIEGLQSNTTYYVAVRAADERAQIGPSSAVVETRTGDGEAPGRVASLQAASPQGGGEPVQVVAVNGSASLSEAWPVSHAFDGEQDTAWASPPGGGEGSFLEASFGAPTRIGRVRLYVGEWVDRFPADIALSADGEIIAEAGDLAPDAHSWVELSFEPVAAEQIRLDILRAGGDDDLGYAVINEISVMPADDAPDTISLTWVAPGDDDNSGQAARYDVRMSTAPITPETFADATPVDGAPAPGVAGTPQQMQVEGLDEETTYFFALRTYDESDNASALSNVAEATTNGVPPARVEDLVAEADGPYAAVLTWTAVGADGHVGTAARYDLRYRPYDLSDATWHEAIPVEAPAPAASGAQETFRVDGLLPGTLYAFALRVEDERGHVSLTSVVARTLTGDGPDEVAPGQITRLTARAAGGDGLPLALASAEASGSQFPDFPQSAAIDGDPDTAWASPAKGEGGEEVLTVQLAEVTAVDEVNILPHDDFLDLFPEDMRIETSVDGEVWDTLFQYNGPSGSGGVVWMGEATPVQHVRITVQRRFRDPAFLAVIGEVRLFEAGVGGTALVSWQAPGDDDQIGTATRYEMATVQPGQEAAWFEPELAPAPAGAPEAVLLSGLPAGDMVIMIRAIDEAGNVGQAAEASVTINPVQ